MNLKEEERRARLLKSRAERLPGIKKQFEEAQGRRVAKITMENSGAIVDAFEAAQNRNFNSNFAPGGKDAGLVGSKAGTNKRGLKTTKKASKAKTVEKTTKKSAKSQVKSDVEQRKVNLSVSTKKGDMVHHQRRLSLKLFGGHNTPPFLFLIIQQFFGIVKTILGENHL